MQPSRAILLPLVLVLTGCAPWDDDGSPKESAAATSSGQTAATTTLEEDDLLEGNVDEVELQLREHRDSGVTGTVTIGPTDTTAVRITIDLTTGGDETRGVEATREGCDAADDSGAIDEALDTVETFTLPDVEDGRMEHETELPSEVVGEGTYSLLVYDGDETDGAVAACAAVKVE